jgi:hypothetical protein
LRKPLPRSVTILPPATLPCIGAALDTKTLASERNANEVVLKSAPLLLTDTDDSPGESWGITHCNSLELMKRAGTLMSPKRHDKLVEKTKFDPITRTVVPPAAGPLCGDSDTSPTISV